MRDFLRRRFDYTTRTHLKRRARGIDLRFLIALAGLALVVFLAVRFL